MLEFKVMGYVAEAIARCQHFMSTPLIEDTRDRWREDGDELLDPDDVLARDDLEQRLVVGWRRREHRQCRVASLQMTHGWVIGASNAVAIYVSQSPSW